MIPLFKTHYSISKSILTLDSPSRERKGGDSDSVLDMALEAKLPEIYLVEDTMASYPVASQICEKYGIKLCFGVKINFTSSSSKEDKTSHKNIIFPKNYQGYKDLIKIFSFYKTKTKDSLLYEDFHNMWTENLELCVPFYDSYLFNNFIYGYSCCPDFRDITPTYFREDNDTPMDIIVHPKLPEGAVSVKSIYYKNREDFLAWQTYKLINRKMFKGGTIEVPNLEDCGSQEFCWESYLEAK